jgi:hypothetical protein
MKHIPQIVNALARRGILLEEHAGKIIHRARAEGLQPDDKKTILDSKPEFLSYLRARSAAKAAPIQPPETGLSSFYQQVWWRWFKDVPILLPYERIGIHRRYANVNPIDAHAAVMRVVARHDALRMHFCGGDGGEAAFHDTAAFAVDFRNLESAEDIAPFLEDFLRNGPRVFDTWLIKACVVQSGCDVTVALALHHTVCDGASYQILVSDLDRMMAGEGLSPAGNTLSYEAFAAWERQWFSGDVFAALTGYWSQWIARLAPLHGPRQNIPLVWRDGARETVLSSLGAATTARVARASRGFETSAAMLLLTAGAIAIARWSGSRHFALRCVADGRTHPDLEGTVGLILRHYLIEADIDAAQDLKSLIKYFEVEYNCAAALSFPTHWGDSGADFRHLHQKIAVTVNYLPVAENQKSDSGTSENGPKTGRNSAPEPWPAALPPIQIRLIHYPSKIDLVFEFNNAVLGQDEQDSLIACFLEAVETLLAANE